MNNKRLYFSSKAILLCTIILIPVIYLLIESTVENIADIFRCTGVGDILLAIIIALFTTVFGLIIILCFAFGIAISCRPVKFTKDGITRGLLFKEKMHWSEVTNVWRGQLLADINAPTVKAVQGNMICIISGDTGYRYLLKYGASDLHLQVILRKHAPKLAELCAKLGKYDQEFVCPKNIIYIKHSDTLYSDILKMWKMHTESTSDHAET